MANPQPGEIVDGYRFKGGNPADQSSWETATGDNQSVTRSALPNVGDVVDGYSFKGGDPSDAASWNRVYAPKEALAAAPGNFVSSIGKRLGEIGTAISDPIGTVTQIGRLGLELQPDNIVKYGALKLKALMSSGEEEKKLNAEASALMRTVEPIFKEYGETYGSHENFWRMIAEDPTRLLSDLSNVAMPAKAGVTGGLTKLGVSGSRAAKVGNITGNIVQNLDAPSAILGAAGKLADLSGKAFTSWGGVKTGLGGATIREAANAAALGGEHFDDFRRGMSGALGEDELVGRARTGIGNMRDKMMADYQAKHGALPTGAIPAWNDIEKAVAKADDSLWKTFPSGQRDSVLNKADRGTWQNVLDTVDRWRNDPTRDTITGLDDLKKAVRNQLAWTDKNPHLERAVTQLTNGILDSVKKHAPPEFGQMLSEYGEAHKLIDELEKEFSLGRNRTPQQSMTKLQSILRNNVNTRYGKRVELADLLEQEGGVRLKSGIAGMTFNTAEPRGLARMAIPGFGVAGLAGGPLGAAIGYGADFLASSPTPWAYGAMGAGLGRRAMASPYARFIPSPASPKALQLERILGAQQERDEAAQPRARGGRAGYAYGGPVRRAAGGDLLAGDPGLVGQGSPYSGIGLGPLLKSMSARGAPRKSPEPPPAKLPQAPELMFAKAGAPGIGSGVAGLVKALSAPQEKEKTAADILKGSLDSAEAKATLGADSNIDKVPKVPKPPTTPYVPGSADEQKYLASSARFESGDNVFAQNPGSRAQGLYQFLPNTWADVIKRNPHLGLTMENLYEKDPNLAREYQNKVMQAFTAGNRAHFVRQFGRDPSGGELYAMHLLGPGGGSRLVAGMDKPITDIIDASAIAGNPFLKQFQSGRDVLDWMNKRFG